MSTPQPPRDPDADVTRQLPGASESGAELRKPVDPVAGYPAAPPAPGQGEQPLAQQPQVGKRANLWMVTSVYAVCLGGLFTLLGVVDVLRSVAVAAYLPDAGLLVILTLLTLVALVGVLTSGLLGLLNKPVARVVGTVSAGAMLIANLVSAFLYAGTSVGVIRILLVVAVAVLWNLPRTQAGLHQRAVGPNGIR
ncbi:hypothetical protein D5S17_27770 [Pseudonocardiaceae bacterium YIM PH 21723]|nr:hypothetical protein D5S17_27770 [Pseudonocardiaceae bacterium YIM PH 21723]